VGRLDGKVALITGAARGQGRSHAVRLAEEGASVVAVDSCAGPDPGTHPWMAYGLATEDDLAETVSRVESAGGKVAAILGDVRALDSMEQAVEEAVARFGGLDIVSANAGISPLGPESWLADDRQWDDVYQVNLLGVRNTCKAAVPAMIRGQRGGSITVTSSLAGTRGGYGLSDYCATKWGVIGFAMSLALEVAPYGIRVNVIAPGSVDTDMLGSPDLLRRMRPDLEHPTKEDVAPVLAEMNLLSVPWVEPVDVSNALVFLSSDEARYITGVVLPVDAGMSVK
jgi:SDR family mycofactocin-dependent oxidoreductase